MKSLLHKIPGLDFKDRRLLVIHKTHALCWCFHLKFGMALQKVAGKLPSNRNSALLLLIWAFSVFAFILKF